MVRRTGRQTVCVNDKHTHGFLQITWDFRLESMVFSTVSGAGHFCEKETLPYYGYV